MTRAIKGKFDIVRNRELDEKIDITLTSVH